MLIYLALLDPSLAAALSARQAIAAFGLIAGAALVVIGLVVFFTREHGRKGHGTGGTQAASPVGQGGKGGRAEYSTDGGFPERSSLHGSERRGPWSGDSWRMAATMAGLVLAVMVGSYLRLDDLAVKTLTHTEAIVPNIEWPADISWPPTRHSFYDTFWWHFHSEGHPQAYYFFMWAWTSVFGTDLTALRVPSALFGILSILLVFRLGTATYDRRVGLLAASLLALSGIHIYWSQYARMYMAGSFLALLSTLLLLRAVSDGRRRWEIAYVLVSWIAVYTQTFFWTILAIQMLWVVLHRGREGSMRRRVLALQALVAILGASALAHVMYLGDDVTLPGPSLMFVAHYLSIGFLFEPDVLSEPARVVPPGIVVALALVALACICQSVRIGGREIVPSAPRHKNSNWAVRIVALGSCFVVIALAVLALRRNVIVGAAALVPVMAAALAVNAKIRTHVFDFGDRMRRWMSRLTRSDVTPLPFMLALLPPALVFALSFWTSMLAPRAFLIFVPYLLIIISAGAVYLMRWRVIGMTVIITLLAVHGASIGHFREYPNDQVGYAELGKKMKERMAPGDLVFVVKDSWVTTPIFYYLAGESPQYVAADYAAAVDRNPDARVWYFEFESVRWGPYPTVTEAMQDALDGYRPQDTVRSRHGSARLFVRADRSSLPSSQTMSSR